MLVLYHSMCDTIRRTFKSERMKNTQLKFYGAAAALTNIAVQTECGTTKAADKMQLAEVRKHTETGYWYEPKGS